MKSNNTIKDAKIINENGRLYVDLTVISDDEHSIREINIPRIALPIFNTSHIGLVHDSYERCYTIDFGMGELPVMENKDGVSYTVKIIKEKRKEMTISEIEKKLGYKIKIVSESDTSIADLL